MKRSHSPCYSLQTCTESRYIFELRYEYFSSSLSNETHRWFRLHYPLSPFRRRDLEVKLGIRLAGWEWGSPRSPWDNVCGPVCRVVWHMCQKSKRYMLTHLWIHWSSTTSLGPPSLMLPLSCFAWQRLLAMLPANITGPLTQCWHPWDLPRWPSFDDGMHRWGNTSEMRWMQRHSYDTLLYIRRASPEYSR